MVDAFLAKYQLKAEEARVLRGTREGNLHEVYWLLNSYKSSSEMHWINIIQYKYIHIIDLCTYIGYIYIYIYIYYTARVRINARLGLLLGIQDNSCHSLISKFINKNQK